MDVLVKKIDQLNFGKDVSEGEQRDMRVKIDHIYSVTQSKQCKTSSENSSTRGTPVTTRSKTGNGGNNFDEAREATEPRSVIARVGPDGVAGAAGSVSDLRSPAKVNKNKKPTIKLIRGENDSANNIISAADKRAWLYVGRTNLSTTTANLKTYLTDKLVTQDVTVDELETSKVDIKRSRSFKVGVSYEYLEQLETPEFWPKGIIIRKFRFFRQPNKFKNNGKNFTSKDGDNY